MVFVCSRLTRGQTTYTLVDAERVVYQYRAGKSRRAKSSAERLTDALNLSAKPAIYALM